MYTLLQVSYVQARLLAALLELHDLLVTEVEASSSGSTTWDFVDVLPIGVHVARYSEPINGSLFLL